MRIIYSIFQICLSSFKSVTDISDIINKDHYNNHDISVKSAFNGDVNYLRQLGKSCLPSIIRHSIQNLQN